MRSIFGALCAVLLAGCSAGESEPPFLGNWVGQDPHGRDIIVTFAADSVTWSRQGDTRTTRHVIYLHSMKEESGSYAYATPDDIGSGRVLRIDEQGTMTVYRGGPGTFQARLVRSPEVRL